MSDKKQNSPIKRWGGFNNEFLSADGYISFHSSLPYLKLPFYTKFILWLSIKNKLFSPNHLDYRNNIIDRDLKKIILSKVIKNNSIDFEKITFTNGGQQALFFIVSILFKKNQTLLFENYNYVGLSRLINHFNIKTKISPDLQKISENKLNNFLKNNQQSVFYLQPDLANPTGKSLPTKQRKLLIKLAKKYSITLIEDLTYRPLYYSTSLEYPTLQQLDKSVISVYSTSKTFFPSLRLGWVIANKKISAAINDLIETNQLSTSLLSKYLFKIILNKTQFSKRKSRYLTNLNTLVEELTNHIPQASFEKPRGGYFLWVKLPKKISYKEMHRAKIIIPPEDIFTYKKGAGSSYYRFSFAQLSLDEIREGVRRLATLFN
jgi:2-aminoadipate transaminase